MSIRQREPRERDPEYLGFIAKLPCIACMVRGGKAQHGVHVAHLRMGSQEYEKPSTGMQEKPHDRWTTPLCPDHHVNGNRSQHRVGEFDFWDGHEIDAFQLCRDLNAAFTAGQTGEAVIARHAAQAARRLYGRD